MFNCEFLQPALHALLLRPHSELGTLLTLRAHYRPDGEFDPTWYVPPEPFWPCSDVVPSIGGPIPLSMVVPGHQGEDHQDHLEIKLLLLKLLPLLLQSLPVQLGEPYNNDPAKRRPRNLPRPLLNLSLDRLFLRGPSGNVSFDSYGP